MTAKRFTINTLDGSIDLRDNNEVMTYKQVVDLLNELNEENKELKFQLGVCRNHKLFSRRELEKENKELKADNKRMVKFIMSKGYNLKDYLDYIKELSE